MHHSSSKFLLKYFVVLTILLLFLLISRKKETLTPIQIQYTLPFLNIDNHFTDSIIKSLSLDEKLALVFPQKNIFIDSNDYNMITDTVFLQKYLSVQIHKQTEQNLAFYCYFLAQSKYADLTDSAFFNFIAKRYVFIDKISKNQRKLTGIFYPVYLQKQVLAINDTTKHNTDIQGLFFKTQISLHIFEYKQDSLFPNLIFNGLTAIKLDSSIIVSNRFIEQFFSSDFNFIYLNHYQNTEIKKTVKELLVKNQKLEKLIDKKLVKILKAKYWLSNQKTESKIQNLAFPDVLNYELVQKSIFIANNQDSILPLANAIDKKYNIIWLTDDSKTTFLKIFANYSGYYFYKPNPLKPKTFASLKYTVKQRTNIIVIDNQIKDTVLLNKLKLLLNLDKIKATIIINSGSFDNLKLLPYSLTFIQLTSNKSNNYNLAAQALFGGVGLSAQTPYSINQQIKFGNKNQIKKQKIGYSLPETVGLNSKKLAEIDKIAQEGITHGAFPGCQIFVAKNGVVVYNKSFGYHTYNKKEIVKTDDVYDIASVTKIAATTIMAMKMLSEEKINLNDRLGKYFKDTLIDYTRIKPDTIVKIDSFYTKTIEKLNDFLINKDTLNINDSAFVVIDTAIVKLTPRRNIFKVHLIDLLKHKSGISPIVPIFNYIYYRQKYFHNLLSEYKVYKKQFRKIINLPDLEIPDSVLLKLNLPDTLGKLLNNKLKEQYFTYFSKSKIKDTADIALTDSLFFRNAYFDTIWRDIKQLPVYSRKFKEYSDINMVLLQMALDSLNKTNINTYLKKELYKPLGLKNISYLPLNYFDKNRIIPTENDNSWRYSLLRGYVHDPSSALLGGVAGNAGLFSNAHNLGILFQMILNGGNYAGKHYIDKKIIEQFTKRFDDTQRGLGFDMPNRRAIVGSKASNNTYGHSGYTGTCVWVDPDNQLVYVFLSNRNYPSSNNWKIIKYHIRERIHDAVYEAMIR